ncbi:MAG TPA: hypothetical protein VGS41_14820, partial [Chthonomonadales bacterium]|nr:hypothetical protein [Chthonomonadales bacterium]
MYYFDLDYPRVRQSLGVAALREAYPTLLLNLRGDICGVNPLALWLWGALQPGEPLHPERLMGVNAYTLAALQMDRMPVEQNEEMYAKAVAIVKRSLARNYESAYAIYGAFIEAMRTDPGRAILYESAPLYPHKEWEYALKISHPQDGNVMLEYTTTIYRLSGEVGFLVVYYPRTSALDVNETMHSHFIEQYGMGDDVITWRFETRGSLSVPPVPARLAAAYRPYYPVLIQDPLWYLRGENEAHRLLVGTSVLDLHFFELFLAPIVRLLLGPIQDSTAPRAL